MYAYRRHHPYLTAATKVRYLSRRRLYSCVLMFTFLLGYSFFSQISYRLICLLINNNQRRAFRPW